MSTTLKKIVVDKYLRKNLPLNVGSDDIRLVFTEYCDFFINKIDGSLLKITDINITTKVEMLKIPNPSVDKLYICLDDKSIYFYNGLEFELLVSNQSPELLALKEAFDEHIIAYNEFVRVNGLSLQTIGRDITDLGRTISEMQNSNDQIFLSISESITGINKEISDIKFANDEQSKAQLEITNSIKLLSDSIEAINLSITGINKSITDIDDKFITVDNAISEIKQSIVALELKTDNIVEDNKIKEYKVEFNINDRLARVEIEDIFDLTSLTFTDDDILEIISVTAKTMSKPQQTVVVSLYHRTIGIDAILTDTKICDIAVSDTMLTNLISFEVPPMYTDGYLLLKVDEDGNNHDNLRITVKIKKSTITV